MCLAVLIGRGAIAWQTPSCPPTRIPDRELPRSLGAPSGSRTVLRSPAPVLLGFPLHCRSVRVLALEPVRRTAGTVARVPRLRAMTRKPSCLISCSHNSPEGGIGARARRHGQTKPAARVPLERNDMGG